jgi:hypothetical protein
MIKTKTHGSTSTPLRGFSTQGYTKAYPIIAPLIDPKKNSKECLTKASKECIIHV